MAVEVRFVSQEKPAVTIPNIVRDCTSYNMDILNLKVRQGFIDWLQGQWKYEVRVENPLLYRTDKFLNEVSWARTARRRTW